MKFETTELLLSATLQTLGFTPDVIRTSDSKFLFVFDKSPELDKTMTDYWADSLKVSPKSLWSNVRELKSRMASYYQSNSYGGKDGK